MCQFEARTWSSFVEVVSTIFIFFFARLQFVTNYAAIVHRVQFLSALETIRLVDLR